MWVSIFDMEFGLIIILDWAGSLVGAPILGHASLAHNTEISKIKIVIRASLVVCIEWHYAYCKSKLTL